MNLLGKTYTPVYVDSGANAKTSDAVSMLYLLNNSTKERIVLVFTDFVSFDRNIYTIVAAVFAPTRSFYFSNYIIKNYNNKVNDYPDFLPIRWARGLVENVNSKFGYTQSIGTKVIYDPEVINENSRELCTVGARDRNFVYQGRYGNATGECDILMKDYCLTTPDDKRCSCIAHQEYLKATAGIDPRYTKELKPYCHVSDCDTDGYLSQNMLAAKNDTKCAPINMCIQNLNITNSEILSSQVVLHCEQNQEQTLTKPSGTDDADGADGVDKGQQTLPNEEQKYTGLPDIPNIPNLEPERDPVTKPPEKVPTPTQPKKAEVSWIEVWWPLILVFFFVLIAVVVIIKKRQSVAYPIYLHNREFFTVDSSLDDGFSGTEFNF